MLGVFLFGCFVFAIVASALTLIAWGIVQERRDRSELAREVAAEPSLMPVAEKVAGDAPGPSATR